MYRHDSTTTVSSPNLRELDSAKTAQLCALKTFYELPNEGEEGSASPCKTKTENKTVLRTKIRKFSGHKKKHIKVYQTKSDVFKFKRKSTITLQNVHFSIFFSNILKFP